MTRTSLPTSRKAVICKLPAFPGRNEHSKAVESEELRLSAPSTPSLSAATLEAAWSATLCLYTNLSQICFQSKAGNAKIASRSCDILETTELRSISTNLCSHDNGSDSVEQNQSNTAIIYTNGENLVSAEQNPIHESGGPNKFLWQDIDVALLVEPSAYTLIFRHNFMSNLEARNFGATLSSTLDALLETKSTKLFKDLNISQQDLQNIIAWNKIDFIPKKSLVHAEFSKVADSQPDAEAIDAWDGRMTYRELDNASTDISKELRRRGVGVGSWVLICFHKSRWSIASMLAVLKAGAAFVPVDPRFPESRIRQIIDVTNATHAVVAESDLAVLLKRSSPELQVVQATRLSVQGPSTDKQVEDLLSQPHDPAVCLFTSGSTGIPKGIIASHAAVCTGAWEFGRIGNANPADRMLQFASYTFDMSYADIVTALLHGSTLCIPSEDDRMGNLQEFIQRSRPTWANLTPTVARLLDPAVCSRTIRKLLLAGELVKESDIAGWIDGGAEVYNVYGPAENVLILNFGRIFKGAAYNTTRPRNTRVWIAAMDKRRLMPVGAIGELISEGPQVADGYLNDPTRTAASFLLDVDFFPNPTPEQSSPRRFYRTGDLARQFADGSYEVIGRADSQVKVGGQRIELSDIEAHIKSCRAAVVLPKKGPLVNRLTAILQTQRTPDADDSYFTPLNSAFVEEIRKKLIESLPPYMIPSHWLGIDKFPYSTSSKLDRKLLLDEVEILSQEQSMHLTQIDGDSQAHQTVSLNERQKLLQEICSQVFNLPKDRVIMNHSFTKLGGDSITAMQISSATRRAGLGFLSVKHILTSKSLLDVADQISEQTSSQLEIPVIEEQQLFRLSPMQQFFVETAHSSSAWHHYNQNVLLRLTVAVQPKLVEQALADIIQRHPMLRARFRASSDGKWMQYIATATDSDFQLELISDDLSRDEQKRRMLQARQSLNLFEGPIVRAQLFEKPAEKDSLLFIVSHHIVIDLVSWRIIVEELEASIAALTEADSQAIAPVLPDRSQSIPFSAWVELQRRHSRRLIPAQTIPYGLSVPDTDFSFWGILPSQNMYSDVQEIRIALDPTLTSQLLYDCHRALRTEPIDILLASIFISFSKVFPEYALPPIFNESHGREPWNDWIDISQTVGWFTVVSPVLLENVNTDDTVDVVRRVKDWRRAMPAKGFQYFSSKYLTEEGRSAYKNHLPAEILFNYEGRYQSLEKEDAILKPESWTAGEELADMGPNLQRFCLFELSAAVLSDGKLHLTSAWNSKTRHQNRISSWLESVLPSVLQDVVGSLLNEREQLTLDNIGKRSTMDYFEIDSLAQTILAIPEVENLGDVEAILDGSPMQDSLALSQLKTTNLGAYEIDFTWEVTTAHTEGAGQSIDPDQLLAAWHETVAAHPTLRTIFLESASATGSEMIYQIVLKEHMPCSVLLKAEDSQDALQQLNSYTSYRDQGLFPDRKPPHRLLICSNSDRRTFVRLQVNHILFDGMSQKPLLQSLARAYGQDVLVSDRTRNTFGDFIRYIRDPERRNSSLLYWKNHLNGVKPCLFPHLLDARMDKESPKSQKPQRYHAPVPLEVKLSELQRVAGNLQVTIPTLVHLAWALVLQLYTGENHAVFGYIASGRDAPIDGIEDAIGPFIAMLVCFVDFGQDVNSSLVELMNSMQECSADAIAHQGASLAEIQSAIGLPGNSLLFNSGISFLPKLSRQSQIDRGQDLIFETITEKDPTEFDLSLFVEVDDIDGKIEMHFDFLGSAFGSEHIKRVAGSLSHMLSELLRLAKGLLINCFLLDNTNWTTHRSAIRLDRDDGPIIVDLLKRASLGDSDMLVCFVCVRPDSESSKESFASEELIPTDADSIEKLRSVVAKILRQPSTTSSLPRYMLPQAYIPINKIPLSTSGKTDRRALQVATSALARDQLVGYTAALTISTNGDDLETDEELLLGKLWEKVLNVQVTSKRSNFYNLGADSVIAMRLRAECRRVGIDLSIAEIFANPDLIDMASLLTSTSTTISSTASSTLVSSSASTISEGSCSEPFSLVRHLDIKFDDESLQEISAECSLSIEDIEDIYPCSPMQEALMAISSSDPKQQAYCLHAAFTLPLEMDVSRFLLAWEQTSVRFAMMRSRIILKPHGSFIVVARSAPAAYSVTGKSCAEQMASQRTQAFSYGSPLLRLGVVLGEQGGPSSFIISVHHAAYDGWSMKLIWDTVIGFFRGDPGPTHPSPSFQSFIRGLNLKSTLPSEDYWKNQLIGQDENGFKWPPVASSHKPSASSSKTFRFNYIAQASRNLSLTTADLVNAVWAMTLARYSDSTLVSYGVTLSGRDIALPHIEDIVGPTIATVPRQVEVRHDMSLADYLRTLQQVINSALPHQHLGLQKIQSLSPAAREACDFNTLLVITPGSLTDNSLLNELGIVPLPIDSADFHPYPLVLECSIEDGSLNIEAAFDPHCIDESTLTLAMQQFDHILQNVSQCTSDSSLSDIGSLMDTAPSHIDAILDFNSSQPKGFVPRLVHEIVEQTAHEQPSDMAVMSHDGTLTYQQLDQFANILAQDILERKPPNSESRFVGLYIDKSAAALVSMLAILKAGCAFVPLDPTQPASRLEALVDTARVEIILTSPGHANRLSDLFKDHCVLPVELSALSQSSPRPSASSQCHTQASPTAHLAYLLYTSGTTGRPKGVEIDHAAWSSAIAFQKDYFKLSRTTRMLQFSNFTFDVSLFEIFTTLAAGGCVCVPSEQARMDDLIASILEMKVNVLSLTPTVARILDGGKLADVELVVFAGEALAQSDIDAWVQPGRRIVNAYGPTEACIYATARDVLCYPSSGDSQQGSAKTDPVLVAFLVMELDFVDVLSGVRFSHLRTSSADYPNTIATKLQHSLRAVLPSFMVPSIFIALNRLPNTASGKLDRGFIATCLGSLNLESLNSDNTEILRPLNAKEDMLGDWWVRLLGVHKSLMTVNSDFFSLGGNSLSAIKLVSLARSLGYKTTFSAIFSNPLLSDMANHIEPTSEDAVTSELPLSAPASAQFDLISESEAQSAIHYTLPKYGIDFEDVEDIYPATPFQESCIASTARTPYAYLLIAHMDIPTSDLTMLKRSWKSAFQRFELLRTRMIPGHNGSALQVVTKKSALTWEEVPDIETFAKYVYDNHDYGQPLARVGFVKAASSLHDAEDTSGTVTVLFSASHGIYDGWSLYMIWSRLFSSPSTENDDDSGDRATPFKEFIRYQAALDPADAIPFWQKKLEGVSGAEFPEKPADIAANYMPMASWSIKQKLPLPTPDDIRQSGATVATIAQAAWALTVSHFSGSSDVIFKTVLSGRATAAAAGVPGIEEMAGPTAVLIPCRTRIDHSLSVSSFLAQCQNDQLEAIPHAHIGWERISRIDEDCNKACKLHSLFNFQAVAFDDLDAQAADVYCPRVYDNPKGFSPDALGVDLVTLVGGKEILVTFHYDSVILHSSQVESIMATFITLFEQMFHKPSSTPVGDLSALSQPHMETRQPQQVGFNGGSDTNAASSGSYIQHLVRQHVDRNPFHPAVESWHDSMTYMQLEDYSNSLAERLVRQGVRSNQAIGLVLDKSPWVIVAILGVLKAGGYLVPFDPSTDSSSLPDLLHHAKTSTVLVSPAYASIFSDVSGCRCIVVAADSLPIPTTAFLKPAYRSPLPPTASDYAFAFPPFSADAGSAPIFVTQGELCVALFQVGEQMAMDTETRSLLYNESWSTTMLVDILAPLAYGGTICCPPLGSSISNVGESIKSFGVNAVTIPVAVSRILEPNNMPALRQVCLYGDIPTRHDVARWSQRARLFLAWGVGDMGTIAFLGSPSQSQHGEFVGAATGTCASVVNPNNFSESVPPGAIGILKLHHFNLSSAHAGQIKTEGLQRFRVNADRTLTLIEPAAERKLQVNGHRIKIRDIEEAIRQHLPSSSDVVVDLYAPQILGDDVRLGAVVTASSTAPWTSEQGAAANLAGQIATALQPKLHASLSPTSIPSFFTALPAFPLTLAGQLDRSRLQELVRNAPADSLAICPEIHGYDAPLSPSERLLASLWIKTLNLDQSTELSRHDHFFDDWSGNELRALRLSAELKRHNRLLHVPTMFDHPTLGAMAAAMQPDGSSSQLPRSED
ncbi:hypothetical protein PTNB29_03930 [Pyrenophora teres f. teres]|nr:hypothetical protein PTNB29_03930 [Pyrenophora teres f. teres]